MPLYRYRCSNCNAELEIQQRITEPALTACPNCETDGLKRIIGAGGGFILKGTGFYNTDYKNAGRAKNGENSSETKTDAAASKPAAHACGAGCAHD
ncbi:MAG: zinc ribbon domain-containing protein [Chloroherpetonaceae bacterium]|nr:zinc ribbon domain-containing protein [Chloroherpetonaceae bacterium]MDW8438180.1 FmdB family zinc ribbon protein [Chloroherpetonaceae bacterium]